MPKIKLNDISMYYEIKGKGEPIVLISGFGADHTLWKEIVEQLQNSHQVISLDNRGSGQTDIPGGAYSIEQMSNDIAELCSKLNIKQAHFVGNSMGGHILQMLAYRHPNLVKSAIISNSSVDIHCSFHIYVEAQLELLQANVPLRPLIKASCSWVYSYQFLTQEGVLDQLIQLTLENPYPFTLMGYEGQYAAIKRFNSKTWVNQIKVPALILGSDQDLIFRETSVKFLAEQIPKAKYLCFSECGHLPMIEYPDKFVTVIKEFIDTV